MQIGHCCYETLLRHWAGKIQTVLEKHSSVLRILHEWSVSQHPNVILLLLSLPFANLIRIRQQLAQRFQTLTYFT